jgi:broad specificity phosphatase PhoE
MKFLDSMTKSEESGYLFIFRHSVKTQDESGLTEDGIAIASNVGKMILEKFGKIGCIKSSPLARCSLTAQHMLEGNQNKTVNIDKSNKLGDPGVFISNAELAGEHFNNLKAQGIVKKQFHKEPIPGVRDIEAGTYFLMIEIMSDLDKNNGLNVYITHDAILAAFVACLIDQEINESNWFGFLDGVCIRKDMNNNYYLQRDAVEYDITSKLQALELLGSSGVMLLAKQVLEAESKINQGCGQDGTLDADQVVAIQKTVDTQPPCKEADADVRAVVDTEIARTETSSEQQATSSRTQEGFFSASKSSDEEKRLKKERQEDKTNEDTPRGGPE